MIIVGFVIQYRMNQNLNQICKYNIRFCLGFTSLVAKRTHWTLLIFLKHQHLGQNEFIGSNKCVGA